MCFTCIHFSFFFYFEVMTIVFHGSSSAYEEGKFCETFHLDASGWRCCESCGKVSEDFIFPG